jgi:hypothetical protein
LPGALPCKKRKPMKKINYIQIIFHFIATWFLAFSFKALYMLYNAGYLEKVQKFGIKNILENHEKYGVTREDPYYFIMWLKISTTAGIMFAFALSIIISIKKKWSILNSFIVLITALILDRFDLLYWGFLKIIFSPGQFFDDLKLNFLTIGIFLLTIGLLVFLSKKVNRIIQNQYSSCAAN